MRTILIWILPIFIISQLNSQTYFPDRCLGDWEGVMHIYQAGKVVDSLAVKMKIEKVADSLAWTWRTEYLAPDRSIIKDYKLLLEDPQSNRFTLDENNGILLYGYVFDNKMYSNFEVMDSYLSSVYSLEGDQLIFEITAGKNLGKTGEDITNFSVNNLQRSVLNRKLNK